MDTRTGQIHEMLEGETMESFAARMKGKLSDFVPVAHAAAIKDCPKCKGTGAIRRGLFSKRFKPCDCVL